MRYADRGRDEEAGVWTSRAEDGRAGVCGSCASNGLSSCIVGAPNASVLSRDDASYPPCAGDTGESRALAPSIGLSRSSGDPCDWVSMSGTGTSSRYSLISDSFSEIVV
jgi:hypothetical protein